MSYAELHLHLGAHKTASSHFQKTLTLLDSLSPSTIHITRNDVVRTQITHANKFMFSEKRDEVGAYLEDLLCSGYERVVISEENLLGEAKDFLNHQTLYANAHKRLSTFKKLLPPAVGITIWLFTRSLDSFLPSMYCEYLRHWYYRPFNEVLGGKVDQSWLRVIEDIRNVFPKARLNIIDYKSYPDIMPKIVNEITTVSIDSIPQS